MAKISDDTKREVLAATDIVDLISPHVKLRRAGSDWKGLCPFHNEKTPSFNVSQTRGRYHCFGCGEGGDAISFVQKFENVTFPEALKILAERAGIRLVEDAFDPEAAARARRRSELIQLHGAATDWFHELLLRDRGRAASAAREYLKKRGINIEVAKRWRLGVAPSGNAFTDWAKAAGYSLPLLLESGLMREKDGYTFPLFRDRLMFPIEDDRTKEPVAFSGRHIFPDSGGGKYINSPESPIFFKKKMFFGLSKTKRQILRAHSAIICEGQLDLITCFEFGIENVVAALGTAFSEQHAKILKRHAEEDVVLCFDADNAGYEAAKKCFIALSAVGVPVRVVSMPEGQDPDSLIRSQGADAFRELIENAVDFFDFQIDHLSKGTDLTTTRGRVAFSQKMAESASGLQNPVARDAVIHKVASRLHIPETGFRSEVESATRRAKKRYQDPSGEAPPSRPMAAQGSNTILMLCRIALTESGIAPFLRKRITYQFLEDIPGTGLLSAIWKADFDASNPEEVSLFIDSLPEEDAQFAGALTLTDHPPAGQAGAEMLLMRLERDRVSILIRQAKTQINAPDLHPETGLELQRELVCLREEFLDLEQRLKDIAQLYPSEGAGAGTG